MPNSSALGLDLAGHARRRTVPMMRANQIVRGYFAKKIAQSIMLLGFAEEILLLPCT